MTAKLSFKRIGLVGKPQNEQAAETFKVLYQHLADLGCDVWVQDTLASDITAPNVNFISPAELGKQVDLVVVVGGDGSVLNAGRTHIQHNLPIIGINRGHLGFLTDIKPTEVKEKITEVLCGDYNEEKRFILSTEVIRNGNVCAGSTSVNDVVVHPGEVSKLLEFELFINGQFVYSQRSDGLIISTPTGSTAYSLSGGGPIVSPKVDAMVLVPMFPHTLSSRPIVVDSNSTIEIVLPDYVHHSPRASCDGQVNIELKPNDVIRIKKHPMPLRILHPINHDYYEVLRTKLGWGQKL
ncbi:MAG: NAD(+) kinase [Kangiellaceae bacterium]|jgi:NAD+ kinase|nr:NAD(+) kinase [Kangiellaceae bacterium]